MDELDAIRITFFQECEELLDDLETGLLALQEGTGDDNTINAVFRAVHSIKGGAGVFGFEGLVRFAHQFEAVLEGVRSGAVALRPDLCALLISAHDELIDHVGAARAGRSENMRRPTGVAVRLADIAATLGEPEDAEAESFRFEPVPVVLDDLTPNDASLTAPAPAQGWTIAFRPHADLYRKANEPAVLLRELSRLGPMRASLDLSDLPPLAELHPEDSYLAWRIALDGDLGRQRVEEVFEFVEGDCDLVIAAPDQAEAAFDHPATDVPALLVAVAAEPALPPPDQPPPVAEAAPAPRAVEAAAPPQETPRPPPEPRFDLPAAEAVQTMIRVDPDKVDRLVDLVGELVISQVMLAQKLQDAGLGPSSALAAGLEELEQLTREIQDGVMAIRAQPVRVVFQRLPRLVRELSALTGKPARLITEGETTEVDRTVIERLAEPLTHMIRNAIDHGLESGPERQASGKPAEGTLRLSAQHRGARIVIEVSDDGRGIDRGRVLATAIARGLVRADADLDDEAIDSLIFQPGFSTATTVSELSGRGVGMDVVRQSVQALGGRIAVSSVAGQGTTISLSLPLTLAVLDGMQIDVCGHTLMAPLAAIVESVAPRPEDVRRIGSGAVLALRDRYVPLIDIGQVLGFRSHAIDPSKGVVLLVETEAGGRVALVADQIHGQRQVVIKSLESNYGNVAGISGATIMGDGRIALIIDIDAVIGMGRRPAPPSLIAAE